MYAASEAGVCGQAELQALQEEIAQQRAYLVARLDDLSVMVTQEHARKDNVDQAGALRYCRA
jgi:hypothetical protein